MSEKTEEATPKKLRDARKKGQIAKSQDFPSAFTFIVSISSVVAMGGYIQNQLTSFMLGLYELIPVLQFEDMSGAIMKKALMTILLSTLPVLMIVSSIGVLVNFLVAGPVFSTEVFKPDIKKFDPIKNIKNNGVLYLEIYN